jgi:hypothetical protein
MSVGAGFVAALVLVLFPTAVAAGGEGAPCHLSPAECLAERLAECEALYPDSETSAELESCLLQCNACDEGLVCIGGRCCPIARACPGLDRCCPDGFRCTIHGECAAPPSEERQARVATRPIPV